MMAEEIAQDLTDRGVALESTLVRDEFDGFNGSAFWAITVLRNGQSYQTEYSAGAAHRHYPKGRLVVGNLRGKPIPYNHLSGRKTIYAQNRNKQSVPNQPALPDVLACLVLDAQCVAFGQTFEDFAAELGYDEDSRRAEKCYNACRDTYFAMIRLFGQDGFEELCELFQDY